MTKHKITDARCVAYELSISMESSIDRVWKGLTDQLGSWWLPSFRMLGEDSLVTLEPKAGGRLYESQDDRELLWYTVLAIEPKRMLTMVGHLSPDFGGPVTSMLTLKLSGSGSQAHLTINDAIYGSISQGLVDSLESGWTELFGQGLKLFVERPTSANPT
jgi:hypothetical protein